MRSVHDHPLRHVVGVPECELSDATIARLPQGSPPAPWQTTVQAVVWFHRASPGASAALPPALQNRPAFPVTVGAFIRYLDTPVGPYAEVLASPLLLAGAPLPASVVPFIAVDSTDSLHGGRANWALPKTLARFRWSVGAEDFDGRPFEVRADDDESPQPWLVRARVATRRRTFKASVPLRDLQLTPDGELLDIAIAVEGRARLASAEVAASGPSLPGWLRPGRHRALVLERARVTFAAPR